ncbi:MAG: GUN4 domain-containing protein [Cyanobacteriota bacterium]
MSENSNQPKDTDAVLGGNAPAYSGVVLGGIGGVKWRLKNTNIALKIAALSEALNYDQLGLDVVLQALRKESGAVYQQLWQQTEPKVRQALKAYTFANGLPSNVGVDYRKLDSLLAAQNWKEADRETAAIMLWISNCEQKGLLTINPIHNFPKLDLYTLDQLWGKYSQGRFGLRIQKHIWQDVGGTQDADYQVWYQFCEQVGWRVNNSWVEYDRLWFHLDAPQGHLPFLVVGGYGVVVCLDALFSRIEN